MVDERLEVRKELDVEILKDGEGERQVFAKAIRFPAGDQRGLTECG